MGVITLLQLSIWDIIFCNSTYCRCLASRRRSIIPTFH